MVHDLCGGGQTRFKDEEKSTGKQLSEGIVCGDKLL
jgi:hypothetical protein